VEHSSGARVEAPIWLGGPRSASILLHTTNTCRLISVVEEIVDMSYLGLMFFYNILVSCFDSVIIRNSLLAIQVSVLDPREDITDKALLCFWDM